MNREKKKNRQYEGGGNDVSGAQFEGGEHWDHERRAGEHWAYDERRAAEPRQPAGGDSWVWIQFRANRYRLRYAPEFKLPQSEWRDTSSALAYPMVWS